MAEFTNSDTRGRYQQPALSVRTVSEQIADQPLTQYAQATPSWASGDMDCDPTDRDANAWALV
jgi:hypothetical protein